MGKIIYVLAALALIGCSAKQPYDLSDVGAGGEGLSTWTELTTTPAADDWTALTDKSDTTGSDDGTSKKVSYQTFVNPRIITKSASSSPLTADEVGGIIRVTADSTVQTLPAVSGLEIGTPVCFQAIGAYTVNINPNDSDGIIIDGSATRQTDGVSIENTSSSSGNTICLYVDSADGWTTVGPGTGTWAVGS